MEAAVAFATIEECPENQRALAEKEVAFEAAVVVAAAAAEEEEEVAAAVVVVVEVWPRPVSEVALTTPTVAQAPTCP